MAVIVESSNTGSSPGADTISVAIPAGVVAGDLLVYFVSARDPNSCETIPLPGGLTLIEQQDNCADFISGICAYKIAAGGEGAQLFTTGVGGNARSGGVSIRISGHDPDFPIDASTENFETNASVGTAPDITTTVDETLLLRSYGISGSASQIGIGAIAGHTQIEFAEGGISVQAAILVVNETVNPDAGVQGTQACITGGSGRWRVNFSVAIAPAAALGALSLTKHLFRRRRTV